MKLLLPSFFLVIFLLSQIPKDVQGSKILVLAFISSKSHKITYEPLLRELSKRGHEITVVSPFKTLGDSKNIREIVTKDPNEDEFKGMPNLFEMKEKGEKLNPFSLAPILGKPCMDVHDMPEVKDLLTQKFDLVFLPAIFNECGAGFVYKLNTTFLLFMPVSAPSMLMSYIGGFLPPSFIPEMMLGYGQKMNFMERVFNLGTRVITTFFMDYKFKPYMENLYREKFNDPSIPSVDEIYSNVSLILSNGHFSIGVPKPFLPDVVEVGGMHCRAAKPLPKDLEDFVNSSGEDGFILFSMGSALKGSAMSEEKRKILVSAFSKIKQKVLWKWETEEMADLPKNVKLSKWLPQQDILGHPKIKAFITHGGFGSSTEAVFHACPLIGIPMFADQNLNMESAEKAGYAITIDWNTITETDIVDAVNKITTDKKYKNKVSDLSKLFRDQPDAPLDRAVFWTEYIIRHKGAKHLRSAARDLNFFQYHSLDVIGFFIAVISTVLILLFLFLKFTIKKILKVFSCLKSSNKSKNSKLKKLN